MHSVVPECLLPDPASVCSKVRLHQKIAQHLCII